MFQHIFPKELSRTDKRFEKCIPVYELTPHINFGFPQVYEQEITETKKRKQVEISELDGRLQVEYEAKLTEALKDLRDQYEEQLRNNRSEVEYLYETKVRCSTFVYFQVL